MAAEFGSHSMICRDESSSAAGQKTASSTERGHEDPCQTMMRCGYDQSNRQLPKFSHDASQHNALFDGLFQMTAQAGRSDEQPTLSNTGEPIFRPPDPPFHPPKIS